MKKLIITCTALLLGASAITAQTAVRRQPVHTTTTTTATKTRTTQATMTPATVAPVDQQPRSVSTPTDVQLQNSNKTVPVSGDIIVPDHAYEPKGTESVGVYGNQTGGSSIGATNTTNGETIKNADNSNSINTTGNKVR